MRKIQDTLLDLAVYSIILKTYLNQDVVIINLYYIYTQNNGTRTEKNWKKIGNTTRP